MKIRAVLRLLGVIVFVLAAVGVGPIPMTPLGLALWCASTLPWRPSSAGSSDPARLWGS